MEFIANILLATGAIGAGLYCHVLSRRLRKFTDLEKGVGGAVAVLSAQVDDLTRLMNQAQGSARDSLSTLQDVSTRADVTATRLELLLASMHDLPQPAQRPLSPFYRAERKAAS